MTRLLKLVLAVLVIANISAGCNLLKSDSPTQPSPSTDTTPPTKPTPDSLSITSVEAVGQGMIYPQTQLSLRNVTVPAILHWIGKWHVSEFAWPVYSPALDVYFGLTGPVVDYPSDKFTTMTRDGGATSAEDFDLINKVWTPSHCMEYGSDGVCKGVWRTQLQANAIVGEIFKTGSTTNESPYLAILHVDLVEPINFIVK